MASLEKEWEQNDQSLGISKISSSRAEWIVSILGLDSSTQPRLQVRLSATHYH
jgi:hypothetical protein